MAGRRPRFLLAGVGHVVQVPAPDKDVAARGGAVVDVELGQSGAGGVSGYITRQRHVTSGFQAAGSYSLIKPSWTGRRRIPRMGRPGGQAIRDAADAAAALDAVASRCTR